MGLNVKSRSMAAFTPWWYRFVEKLLLIVCIACQAQYGMHISIILWVSQLLLWDEGHNSFHFTDVEREISDLPKEAMGCDARSV